MGENIYNTHKAAFSAALTNNAVPRQHSGFVIKGELSGIQDYIFNIPSKGAAKYLKGRSAYLQLLPEAIARYIHNNMQFANKPAYGQSLVFSGGGNFMLLYHTTDDLSASVANCHKYIEDILLQYHNGRIYLALAGTATNKPGYEGLLAKALHSTKKQKFKTNPAAFMPFDLLENRPRPGEDAPAFYKSFQTLTQRFTGQFTGDDNGTAQGWQQVLAKFGSTVQQLQQYVTIVKTMWPVLTI